MAISGLKKRLVEGGHLAVCGQELSVGSCWKHLFSHYSEVSKVVDFVQDALKKPGGVEAYASLGDALIDRYKNDRTVKKIIECFDRQMARYRSSIYYRTELHQKGLAKWQKAGQPPEIYSRFPEFVSLLESSRLLSQIRVSRDTLQIVDDEPAILVEGRLEKQTNFLQRFELKKAPKFGGQLVVAERTTHEVYTYLDNGRGLEKHDPYLSTNNPISTLSEEEYRKTWEKAKLFVRPDEADLSAEERALLNQDRPFILQYVTSRMNKGESNFSQLLLNPKHPYLRLIIGVDNPEVGTRKGQVYEVGYGWKERPYLPLSASKGLFQTPDSWEFVPSDKVVTNIPISQEEAKQLRIFVLRYHNGSIHLGLEPGFSLTSQNCSVFAKEGCRAAGVEVPTAIGLKDLIGRICPTIIQKTYRQLNEWREGAARWLRRMARRFTPKSVFLCAAGAARRLSALLGKIRDTFIAFVLTPLRAFLGGAAGDGGVAFRQSDDPPVPIEPPLRNPRNWFRLSSYRYHLPGIAQEWQLRQASTVVYKDPVRLSIVPPDSIEEEKQQ